MNPEGRREGRGLGPEELVWQRLVKAQNTGQPLTPEEQRALTLRRVILFVANTVSLFINYPTIKEDQARREVELNTRYIEEISKLADMGVTPNMHVGKPQKAFENPLTVAEWIGGQWVGKQNRGVPSFNQAGRNIEEFSETRTGVREGPMPANVHLVQGRYLTPTLEDWTVLRGRVNVTLRFLALGL